MDGLRFFWIFLCFLLSFWGGLPLAAFFTLWADYFLLFTEHYAVGLVFFLLVQTAYLQNLRGRPFPLWAVGLLPLGLCLPLPLLGIGYGLLFCFHIKEARKKVPSGFLPKLYLLGLILFALCDITVAWGYFHRPNPGLIWLFYAPSQLLLAVTARFIPIR